jgi:hypothetical protein
VLAARHVQRIRCTGVSVSSAPGPGIRAGRCRSLRRARIRAGGVCPQAPMTSASAPNAVAAARMAGPALKWDACSGSTSALTPWRARLSASEVAIGSMCSASAGLGQMILTPPAGVFQQVAVHRRQRGWPRACRSMQPAPCVAAGRGLHAVGQHIDRPARTEQQILKGQVRHHEVLPGALAGNDDDIGRAGIGQGARAVGNGGLVGFAPFGMGRRCICSAR